MNIAKPLVAAAFAAVVLAPASAQARPSDDFQATQAATARFHSINQATASEYGELRDAAGIACIDDPAGGMGIHYANNTLVVDPALIPTSPEVLVYQPMPEGGLKLVALEYVILESAWRIDHPDPEDVPSLFDQDFERLPGAGEDEPQNRYGLPAFYELHLWLWKPNPAGMFDDWNPDVTCS
ncbi:MAG TPA: hypothetical protein VFO98_09610 [Marmoricola sp.]|nr:hypothetical protein [Marmoricola sp.]